ncbi:hypothetical protein [Halobacillus salinus]|uniref:DUF11 domain-containing protein n=1 Tax=Halobacillus salinus TaxID=192814 RepID=A0A4Z0GTM7_9BACI|nr:hypothetical protein [Halobacillus salinus]TGB00747.1 hypothetical protein E4663_19215 [Halobacillus salinus]
MADICQGCDCTPYENVCACPTNAGITVTQPACQTLPDGSITGNPCFRPSPENRSYWSYKFNTDNTQSTRAISGIVIPICQNIVLDNIIVEEKIDGCGSFEEVPFTLSMTDPNFGPAPAGYQWVKIETNERYGKAVAVEYRLEIVGNFPVGTQAIKVKAATNILTFSCQGCFLVPQCPEPAQLNVNLTCEEVFADNRATLNYRLDITNTGGTPVTSAQLTDTITFNPNITLGPITISDPTLMINRTVPGRIVISGNLGTIDPGEEITITYSIPVVSVTGPGEYLFENNATVVGTNSQASDFCELNVDVVQLAADKCCSTDGARILYRIDVFNTPNSPESVVSLFDVLTIPQGLTVQLNSTGGCEARFPDGTEVPLNTDIVGPRTIEIRCNDIPIQPSSTIHRDISLTIVASTTLSATINNTFQSVTLETDNQIDLGTLNLPFSVDTDYEVNITCSSPCLIRPEF